jgi:hypothetical protein
MRGAAMDDEALRREISYTLKSIQEKKEKEKARQEMEAAAVKDLTRSLLKVAHLETKDVQDILGFAGNTRRMDAFISMYIYITIYIWGRAK